MQVLVVMIGLFDFAVAGSIPSSTLVNIFFPFHFRHEKNSDFILHVSNLLDFFFKFSFDSEYEHTQYKQIFSITLFHVYSFYFAESNQGSEYQQSFIYTQFYIYSFLKAGFPELRQISGYRHHY